MINNIFLCSFASDDLSRSKKRFLKQARFFYKDTNIKIYDQKDLFKNFRKKIKKNLLEENRAFGYGIWKPYIVLDFFKNIPKNSVLQYSDIGCHFNSGGVNRFKNYIKIANKYKSLVFEYDGKKLGKNNDDLHFQKYLEFQYSKKDLIKYFKYEKNSKILNSPQIWSGTFFLKKTLRNEMILKNWLKVMKKNHLIDGTKSKNLEDPRFMEEVQKFSKIIGISHSFSLIKNKAMQGASLEEIASFRATVEEFLVRIIKMEGKPLDLLQKSSIASSLASVPPQEYADFIDKFLTLQEWVSGHQKYAIMHRLSALDSGRRCAPDFLETLLQDTRDLAPAERASEILRRLRRLGKDTSV